MIKKIVISIVLLFLFPLYPIKVLHISFHKGCINDFKEVAQDLDLELVSWFVQDKAFTQKFDPVAKGNAIYNVGHDRAKRVWDRNKDFFDQFDVIVTSDTAPLSRIFLQNGWEKPLIIWVCNRFDYFDGPSLDCYFPDAEYYSLFKNATKKSNVRVISYTPYEYVYAARHNIDISQYTIKPIGAKADGQISNFISAIPTEIDKSQTIFITPRLSPMGLSFVQNNCAAHNIITYSGVYNGPFDLKDFKGILCFPYAWSNLALFENIQYGMIHFVPSINFLRVLANQDAPIPYPGFSKSFVHDQTYKICEWYLPEHEALFVYFDSWKDLKYKIENLDQEALKKQIITFSQKHRRTMLEKWQDIFSQLVK